MFKILGFLFGFIGMMLFMSAINCLIIKLAWAYSVTPMFGIREPGWIEAYALSVLTASLFKSYSPSSK